MGLPAEYSVYGSGTDRIDDPGNELQWAEGLSFATAFPGGDMDASFVVKRDIVAWWALKGAQRIVFRHGQRIIYEGYVSSLDRLLDEQGAAIRIPLVGAWSHILMNRRWQKYWADSRNDESVWRWVTTRTGAEKCNLDRNTRLRFTPKAVVWANNDLAAVLYEMPVGETVKRVTFSYDFKEAAQAWTMGLQTADSLGVGWDAADWTITADGTGTQDITLATPRRHIRFYYQNTSGGNQTGVEDGTIYGQVSNVVVYSETGAIDLTQVSYDVIDKFTELNGTVIGVGSNTLSLVPFITDWGTIADIIVNACSFGDSSNNRWGAYILNSENAPIPDGRPVLAVEPYPALTDYDLAIRLDETNIAGAIELNQDFESIYNWVVVQYADENGWPHWITPDDYATLKDTTSIGLYGQRDALLNLGYSTATVALSNGVRFLTAYKDPQWNSSPIPIWDYIRKKSGETIPPVRIRAGMRLKIENFTQDLSGTGLTLLITSTRYDDESGVCTLTFGQPMSPLMTILAPPPRIVEDVISSGDTSGDTGGDSGGDSGGGGSPVPESLNFYKTNIWKKAIKMGLATKGQFKTLTAKQKKALKRAVRRKAG